MLISAPARSVHVLDWPLSFSFFSPHFSLLKLGIQNHNHYSFLFFIILLAIEALSESLSRYVLIILNNFLTIMIKKL